jgi:lycopene beta-cyclase
LAGLLLAHHLTTKFELASKRIVIIEQSLTPTDHPISFWAKPQEIEQLPLADSLLHTWSEMQLITKRHTHIDQLHNYRLSALNQQRYVKLLRKHLQTLPPIVFLNAAVTKLSPHTAITAAHEVEGQYIFDSTSLYRRPAGPYLHSAAKCVITAKPMFDAHVGIFFDTRIATTQLPVFARVLPLDASTAIVEVSAFGADDSSRKTELLRLIDQYTAQHLQLGSRHATQPSYYVTPLICQYEPPQVGIIPLGANAGLVKRTTGHSFLNTVRHARHIAHSLAGGRAPKPYVSTKRFFRSSDDAWLRKTMAQPLLLERFYDALTEHVSADQLLAWLDEHPSPKTLLTISRAATKLF